MRRLQKFWSSIPIHLPPSNQILLCYNVFKGWLSSENDRKYYWCTQSSRAPYQCIFYHPIEFSWATISWSSNMNRAGFRIRTNNLCFVLHYVGRLIKLHSLVTLPGHCEKDDKGLATMKRTTKAWPLWTVISPGRSFCWYNN